MSKLEGAEALQTLVKMGNGRNHFSFYLLFATLYNLTHQYVGGGVQRYTTEH